MYADRKEVVYYRSREELHGLIQEYRRAGDERRRIAEAGLARTAKEHTYQHRVATMMGVIKERLGLS
jgi:spore maturation protein CgeB